MFSSSFASKSQSFAICYCKKYLPFFKSSPSHTLYSWLDTVNNFSASVYNFWSLTRVKHSAKCSFPVLQNEKCFKKAITKTVVFVVILGLYYTYRNRLCASVLYGISASVSLWCSICSCLPTFVTHLNTQGIPWDPSEEFQSKDLKVMKCWVSTAK